MQKKIKASQRVIYSINMVVYTYLFLKSEVPENFDVNLHNCHLESFLTHSRNLNWFFLEKKQDDIYIGDFTAEVFPRNLDSELISKINKSLSHLTYFNIDNKPSWPIESIALIIFPNCIRFLELDFFNQNSLESPYLETRYELIPLLKDIVKGL